MPASLAASASQWLREAVLAAPGKISMFFDDSQYLRLNFTSEYRGHLGRLSFQILTTSPAALSRFAVSVALPSSEPADSVKLSVTQAPAESYSPGDQGRLQITVECLKPFAGCPDMNIRVL
jgi:hypothetical protein